MRLKDKVAIITGGAHGMGEVEARLFAEEGARVIIADVLVKEGEAVAADISVGQRQARFVRTDVTLETDWQRLIAETIAAYGKIDILVNNAGISGSAVGDADSLEGWQRLLAVNSTSVFLGTKLAAAEMTKAGGGSIINISSIMGIVASEESHPGYPASKAAVRNYTKAAACRYGPQGVRVNSVHPGYMPPMLNATNAAGRQAKIAQTPLRRLGEPIEVAYGVLFLASDEASFVTGAELVISLTDPVSLRDTERRNSVNCLTEGRIMVQAPTHQIPGVYHRRIGDIIVTALSDGYLDGTVDVLQNIRSDEAMRILNENFRPGRRTSVNCYAIFSAGRLALIETGSGDYLLPTAGKLQQNLAAAGIDPAAIERVLLTHMHPDHSAGLTDPKTGRRLFPNADLVVHENEPRHWNDDTAMATASERAKLLYFQCAREQMAPYQNVMHTFSGSVDVFPGVTSVPLHGHTPGHSGYMISSGKDSLLIWGDIVHVPDIQIPRPEVTIEFDTDPHAAAATRKQVLDMVATDRQLVAGMHMHYPGFAHVVKQGDSYLMLPEPWDQGF